MQDKNSSQHTESLPNKDAFTQHNNHTDTYIDNMNNYNTNKESSNNIQKSNSDYKTMSFEKSTHNKNYIQTLKHYYANIVTICRLINKRALYYWHVAINNDILFHYAASLSFYSIFSIIPAFLMLFSLISLFPSFQDQMQILKQSILDTLLPANTLEVARILDNFLSNGKEMGFVGFLISLVSSFIFFRNFDDVAARIFEAQKRSYFDSFIIYWLLITLMPLFLSTSIYFNTMIMAMYSDILTTKIYACVPMLATWLIFVILFRVAANKPLRFFVLTLSSLFGSFVWYALKILFFYYMSYNKFYSSIYGSVSFIMFAFLWIYVSWLVVLFSMQFCKWLDTKYPCNSSSTA